MIFSVSAQLPCNALTAFGIGTSAERPTPATGNQKNLYTRSSVARQESFASLERLNHGSRVTGCAVKRWWSTAGGVNPPGNWFAPPGSNQSSSGGNDTAEASGAQGLGI